MATSKGRRAGPSGKGSPPHSAKNDASQPDRSSQADGSAPAPDADNDMTNAQTATRDSTQRSRNKRSGGKATGDSTSNRRARNEPGHYQKRDDESDVDSDVDFDVELGDPTEARANGVAPQGMEFVSEDDDIEGDALGAYETDEGDGDIDWDDSIPSRGGGKSSDR